MKVRELQAILTEWHPDEEVCLFTQTGKYMVILGVNGTECEVAKCCVLSCDWSRHDEPTESESDKLRRERDLLNEKILKLDKEEYKATGGKKKAHRKAAAKRNATRKALAKPTDQETDQETTKTAL